jgi:hypothetical protein
MAADFWALFAAGAGAVLAGSLGLEALLAPRPRLTGRPPAAWAVHIGLCLLTYGLELILFQRPVFGAVAALSTLLLLVVVSNIKAHMLCEPFLFQDVEYFTDLIRHPRLYLPFFGVWRALVGVLAFIAAVYAGMVAEDSLLTRGGWGLYLCGLALLTVVGGGLLRLAACWHRPMLSFDPIADLKSLGFLGYLWWYRLAEREPIPGLDNSPFSKANIGAEPPSPLPHLVVVQSESFFDPRRLHPGIAPTVTAAFDRLRQTSIRHGLLQVPAWGANTVRTEFAFLSGLGAKELRVHQFNPYRKLAGQPIPTIASYLKSLGYKTVCVHPYSSSFYRRDQAYTQCGIDRFISITEFSSADYRGPYVGDVAVGRKIRDLLECADSPLFIFTITMENHGPLHWEKPTAADEARLYQTPPPQGFDDLTVYLRHLENAGRMLEEVRSALNDNARDGWLCWYGDHVPIMPEVYAATGFCDGQTDYFIWQQASSSSPPPQTLQAE